MIDFMVVYLLLRGDEKRSGTSLDAGKASIHGTLSNVVAYGLLTAVNLMVVTLLLDYRDWRMFRLGIAIAATMVLLGLALVPLRRSIGAAGRERAGKYFQGFNTVVVGLAFFSMLGGLIFLILELASNEYMKLKQIEEPLKIYLSILVTTGIFGFFQAKRLLSSPSLPR